MPSGSCSWSGHTLTITTGLTLTGAGMGSTVLTSTSTFIDVFPDSTAIANEDPSDHRFHVRRQQFS